MGARAEISRQLRDAVGSPSLVRVRRSPRNADTVDGFPVSVGSKWVLIAQTGSGGFFDGLVALRLKDVVKVQPDSAGSGLATSELLATGSEVTALEPGERLAHLLVKAAPAARVIVTRLEDAELPNDRFDSVVAATSMHWVDLSLGLPILNRAVRPGGWLALWRSIFGDDMITTPFREQVARITAARPGHRTEERLREHRPTMDELAEGGWFTPVDTIRRQWSVDLTTEQVGNLFSTFSDWTASEVAEATTAAEQCGGIVTEHYNSLLHVLKAASVVPSSR